MTSIWKRRIAQAVLVCGCAGAAYGQKRKASVDTLLRGFQHPPAAARLRCYWWWLNGHTTKAAITRDLEEMQKKGYGGALLVDANGSNQVGNDNVPAGPEFGSPAWTELYVHALKEADRLGLEITLNITSGWNLGGPWVQPETASKLLTWSRNVAAGETMAVKLEMPPVKNGFYRQITVLAYPLHRGAELPGEKGSGRDALGALKFKSAAAEMGFSMPDATGLLTDASPEKKDEDADLPEIHDITDKVDADGTVRWSPPEGRAQRWELLRIGYTDSDARVSTSSGAWQGLAIDYLDPSALDLYWQKSVLPLLEAGKPYVGKSLKYLASDSWELGGTNWTDAFREEFKKRRGYDPVPYLPVVSGRIVGSRELSTRFLADLRRTVADLINGHYDRMAMHAKQFGLGIQCESGGPHGAPFDALETFRSSAIPQTEYWAMSKEHRTGDSERFFVKEASSASHIYGRPLVAAEGMTSIGNQWNESLGMNLRPSFDQALTEGLNRLVWHEFTSSPPAMGLPGQEYFAGTHLNPNVTWWRYAEPFLMYLNRSQFMLQQGQPVSDVLYYYGDNVPNFVRLKRDDPAAVLPGYDYDVTSTDALLQRFRIEGGVIQTPEGIRYKVLVLPRSRILPLPALELAKRYVEAGGTLVGLRPLRSQGLVPEADAKRFAAIADELWGECETSTQHRRAVGKGQLLCTESGREALHTTGVLPDFEPAAGHEVDLDYVHRRTAEADIYFIRNTKPQALDTAVTLRVSDRQPELFHADSGQIEETMLFTATPDRRTRVQLSLDAYGSVFVVFRHTSVARGVTRIARQGELLYSAEHADQAKPLVGMSVDREGAETVLQTSVAGTYEVVMHGGQSRSVTTGKVEAIELSGPWTLRFPPNWGAPAEIRSEKLRSWTDFDDVGVRYFSGTAMYETTVRLTEEQLRGDHSLWLDLGEVHEVAAVRVNGKMTEIVWKAPYAVRVDRLLKAGENVIEIEVTNLWPNRLIGDAQSPAGRHYTWTNIRTYTKDSPLLPSGLIGPVVLKPLYRVPSQ